MIKRKILCLGISIILISSFFVLEYVLSKRGGGKENMTQEFVVTKEQAVKIADKFIVENGYTDIKATLSKEKIFVDLIEQNLGESIEEILELRFNSIEREHCRVYSEDVFWYVAYRKINNPAIARAVIVNKNTGEAKMMHEEVTAEEG